MSNDRYNRSQPLTDEQRLVFALDSLVVAHGAIRNKQFAEAEMVGHKLDGLPQDLNGSDGFLRIERGVAVDDTSECYYHVSTQVPPRPFERGYTVRDEHTYRTEGGYIYTPDTTSVNPLTFNANKFSIMMSEDIQDLITYIEDHEWMRRRKARGEAFLGVLGAIGRSTLRYRRFKQPIFETTDVGEDYELAPDLDRHQRLHMNLETLVMQGPHYSRFLSAQVDVVDDPHASTFAPYTRVERRTTGDQWDTPHFKIFAMVPGDYKRKPSRLVAWNLELREGKFHIARLSGGLAREMKYFPITTQELIDLTGLLDPTKLAVRKPNKKLEIATAIARLGNQIIAPAFAFGGYSGSSDL